MKINCPACAAKYSIADEKVQDKLAKIRCRKCGTTIVIDGKVSPANVYAGDASASHAEQPQASNPNAGVAPGEYSVDLGDNDQRTMTMDALVEAYNTGVVTAETYVWTEGMEDWVQLGQVPAIVDALHAANDPAAASAAAAASAPAMAPDPGSAPVVGSAPESAAIASSEIASQGPWEASPAMESPSAVRAAAKPGGGRGSTADLFGAFESAGSEADVSTSAPQAAAAPAPAPEPAPAAAGGASGTGARNESSVLFSLSALTASASTVSASSASTAASTGSGTQTKEDSGLIDLKALTAAADAPAQAPAAPMGPSPLGMAPPLGLAPPLGGGVEAQIAMPTAAPQKSRTGLYIGGGIAVAALAIAAAIVATSSKPAPPPTPTVAATAPPVPTQTAEPKPTATEEKTTAKPPATGTAEEEKKAPKTAAKHYTGHVKSTKSTSTKSTTKSTTTKSTTKKPVKKTGGCGCASGDLQCAMRCAAKGG